ncbi:hypothetical protein CMQ_7014 [Grosmannia clavigera kw1407]|uniref:Uncharacterized protein n=1 Tax=Grosmannia clavigera (strain kw1407 / UAMH 11150) TaxID=655863 RepID=F0X770_GROCL|nr:uncharacterized protein CMQ_7014 [Grosmannia clavigera kw1407]EFX06693.1 hypothetical protein CMQ_7014 [Grosmannia clavigera kw1407]
MFCLRSWLPLLFIPTNASPTFIFLFFVCTYFLNRPCVYCSFLLLILFLTSCNWSDRCFFDFSNDWFEPREITHSPAAMQSTDSYNGTVTVDDGYGPTAALVFDMVKTTASAMAGATAEKLSHAEAEWTGVGIEWLRSLLGRREWRIDCMDVNIRL